MNLVEVDLTLDRGLTQNTGMTTAPTSPVGGSHREPPAIDVRRYRQLQRHDQSDLYAVVDAAVVAHVAYVRDGYPVIIPMAYCRVGNDILMHGSTAAGVSDAGKDGAPLTASIAILDGLVFEQSMFLHTLNYRSATIFGLATPVANGDKEEALRAISEWVVPGRWDEAIAPTKKELAATHILKMSLDRASVKISAGGPREAPIPGVWNGHVPIQMVCGNPIAQDGVTVGVSPSVERSIVEFRGKFAATE